MLRGVSFSMLVGTLPGESLCIGDIFCVSDLFVSPEFLFVVVATAVAAVVLAAVSIYNDRK